MSRSDLVEIVFEAVTALGGKASVAQVAKYIWDNYSSELQGSKILYTWQYDMRWAALKLRKAGQFKSVSECDRGAWEIA